MAHTKTVIHGSNQGTVSNIAGRRMSVLVAGCSVHPTFRNATVAPVRRGIASLGNILGNRRMFEDYIGSSDREALRRDWVQVGSDIRVSMSKMIK